MSISKKNLFVKKSNLPAAGKGLFTRVNIQKHDRIVEYKGNVRAWKDVKAEDGYNKYLLRVNRTTAIDALPTRSELGRYANDAAGLERVKHFSNNAEYLIYDNRCFIEATREICAGEEIFVGYGKEFWALQKKLAANPD